MNLHERNYWLHVSPLQGFATSLSYWSLSTMHGRKVSSCNLRFDWLFTKGSFHFNFDAPYSYFKYRRKAMNQQCSKSLSTSTRFSLLSLKPSVAFTETHSSYLIYNKLKPTRQDYFSKEFTSKEPLL